MLQSTGLIERRMPLKLIIEVPDSRLPNSLFVDGSIVGAAGCFSLYDSLNVDCAEADY